jgi:hypothetical protein
MRSKCWRARISVGAINAACRHGEQRDDRLARADVALQQAQHALGRGEIGADFAERFDLRRGEAEGQGSLDLGRDAPVSGVGAPRQIAHARAHHQKRELIGEQFVIGEPHRGGADGVDILGPLRIVHRRQSRREGRRAEALGGLVGDPFG